MNERQKLLESIASTTADYRAGEIAAPTPQRADRWVRQFDAAAQIDLLRELDHVLTRTYFSKTQVAEFLKGLVGENKLTGKSPCDYWKKAHFLRIQKNGHSQRDLLAIFDEVLNAKCGFKTASCGKGGGDFVYLDDAIFSGGRVGNDLTSWIERDAPEQTVVHVVVVATHAFAEYKMPQRIAQAATDQKKKITLCLWRIAEFENKLANRYSSEVLWPARLPDNAELRAYLDEEKKFPFKPRQPGGKTKHDVFRSEEGRQLLEGELLMAGMRIRSFSQNPSHSLRPLGFSPFGVGFGSLIITFRNCPNNCPLALWWGDPAAPADHPFSKWYPLFLRKTYASASAADFDAIEL